MNPSPTAKAGADHPSAELLVAFGQGRLDAASHADIERHVADCETCCQALQIVPDDTLAVALRGVGGRDETLAIAPDATVPAPAIESEQALPKELVDHPRYRVVRPLGKGGMGVVYQAEHRLMDRPVALKVINRRLTSSPTAVERFRLEVKAAARLSHPSIVTAHDAEQAGDLHFLVMEYVEGVSLARQVEKRGPLSVLHACNFMRQAAQGLQHAFERGMVHRDIKPQNLMLNRKGQIKILDFGLARLAQSTAEPAAGDGATATDPSAGGGLTMDGVVLGTPDYIAPEQVSDSRAVDIRADIYSLGCTLYYLLTGSVPFPSGTPAQKVVAHINRAPASIAALRADLPADLVAVVERMMAKDPATRFQTPAEVAAALLPFSKPGGAANTTTEAPATQPAGASTATVSAAAQPLDALLAAMPLDAANQPADPLAAYAPLMMGQPAFGGAAFGMPPRRGGWRPWFRDNRRWVIPLACAPAVLLVGWLVVAGCVTAFGKAKDKLASLTSSGPSDQVAAGGAVSSISNVAPAAAPVEPSGTPVADLLPAAVPPATPAAPIATAPGKRVLLVIANKDFWYADYEPVRRVLEQGGAHVTVASSSNGIAVPHRQSGVSNSPQSVQPDIALADARPEDYDAIVFTGGGMDEFMWKGVAAEAMRQIVKPMMKDRKWVTSLCAGNKILAGAGVLKGHDAALNPYIPEDMKSPSVANWVWDRPVVVSDRIITAASFEYAEQFAQELLRQLSFR